MRKYHFRINNSVRHNTAGSKAVDDCRKIMLSRGYTDIEIHFNKSLFLFPYNFLKLAFYLFIYLLIIKKKSLVVIQYPLLGINRFFKYYAKLLKLKGCKISCIIHDIEVLRKQNYGDKRLHEINFLNTYDAVIAHNSRMSNWLLQNGFEGYITEIILFDYLKPGNNKNANILEDKKNTELTISFAGNLGSLGKSNFLRKLSSQKNSFSINLYGPGFDKNMIADKKIKWLGSFSPDKIVEELKGDYGLIWDGDSVENISGLMGEYLQYNSPHKTSLYLVAGLPVIVSETAAVAGFIKKNNLGICIKSISDISKLLDETDNNFYNKMKENVLQIGEKLQRGDYLNAALKNIEDHFLQKVA